jgi:hypothetical protein
VVRDIPGDFEGWVRVWDPGLEGAAEVGLALPHTWGWIEGIALAAPRPHVRWPWAGPVSVGYHRRAGKREAWIRFSVSDLLAEHEALDLVRWVDPGAPVMSDDSGLVFLRTRFAAVRE